MMKLINKINIKALILSIYFSLVCCIEMLLKTNTLSLLIVYIFISSFFLFDFLFVKFELIKVAKNNQFSKKDKVKVFLLVTFVTFALMFIRLIAFYPGSFSPDSINQYEQSITGKYCDWHPVWHTLVFFTLPLRLTGNISSIVVFQIIYFSLAMGYLALTIYEMLGIKAMVFACLYILLNPYVGNITLYPWKDVAFAIFGLLCFTFSIRLIIYKNNELSIWRVVLFCFFLVCATIFRHNAIFFTVPLIIALLFNIDKKMSFKILTITTLFFLIIKVPLYNALNVEKPDQRVTESMGLPLTIIGNVIKETPEKMDKELKDFAYSIATQEQWQEHYDEGNFNSIKWESIDTSCVEEKGYFGMLKLMFKSFILSPVASFRALFALTDIVYGFENGTEGDVGAGICPNDYGIDYVNPNNKISSLFWKYSEIINDSILVVIRTHGIAVLTILFSILMNLNFKKWSSWKDIFILFPILIYDFGTMLLLTGPDSRFFYITFLVTPLIITYSIYSKGKNTYEQ